MIRSVNILTRLLYKSNRCFVREKVLSLENMNRNVKEMYLSHCNDPVYLKYIRYQQRLKQCPGSLPFNELLPANSGDMQANGYEPLTFIRQMASAALYPALLEHKSFPDDVKCKVTKFFKHHNSLGSYTASPGVEMIRKKLAEYLCRRDSGVRRSYEEVILNGGATEGIRNMLKLVNGPLDSKQQAVLIPSPSHPYGLIEELGFKLITYELDEENRWGSTTESLEKAISEAKEKYAPRAMLVINPSNPTGTVLKPKEMQTIIKFACKEKLMLIVDESYQRIIFGDNPFHSFKKVLACMGEPYSELQLTSVFGLSKDIAAETAIRGGSMEITNFDEHVLEQFLKSISVNLCSSSVGQVMMYAFADHPVEGDPSYETWKEETEARIDNLACKAKLVVEKLNTIDGYSCPPIEGGYFAFPKIHVPKKAADKGKEQNYNPSTFYALKLLEETGVLVTPGDVYGNEKNPHIRFSILPPEEKLKQIFDKIKAFNEKFLLKYCD